MLACPLLNDLIRPRKHRRRDRETEGLGGLQVDHQLELGGLLDGNIASVRASQDLVDLAARLTDCTHEVWSVRDQPACSGDVPGKEHGRKPMSECEVRKTPRWLMEERITGDQHRLRTPLHGLLECRLDG